MFEASLALCLAFVVSLASNAALVATRDRHVHLTSRDQDASAIQAMHRSKTPRVGGLGVMLALFCVLIWFLDDASDMILIAVSTLPVFAAGLSEDVGYHVSPRDRLIAAAISSLFAAGLLGVWLNRLDIPGIDQLMPIMPIGVVVTAFFGAGVCHATNLIDGMNGLAGVCVSAMALGLAAIAHGVGQNDIAFAALALVPALLGFLLLNWPKGKIFLGDAGAYSFGHILAWLGILLAWRVEEVAAFSIALVFFWPVADTIMAILRRRMKNIPTGQPDRMHMHHIVMRALEIGYLGRNRREIANPMTTLVLTPFVIAPVVSGVLSWNNPVLATALFFLWSAIFAVSYFLVIYRVRAVARPTARTR